MHLEKRLISRRISLKIKSYYQPYHPTDKKRRRDKNRQNIVNFFVVEQRTVGQKAQNDYRKSPEKRVIIPRVRKFQLKRRNHRSRVSATGTVKAEKMLDKAIYFQNGTEKDVERYVKYHN